ncbi:S1 family peptidase [Nocardioides sp. W7]|uniref:S1 family peptidase n=1 Tax=Nocardioides sp. W7 TaxID=2931390 RepID=UPI001FD45980|nr:S1 family peptidase [Nocardioides sp. W7]
MGLIAASAVGAAFGESETLDPDVVDVGPNPELYERTIDTAEKLAGGYERAGFAGTVVDPDKHAVTIRWAGEIPADIAKMAGEKDGVTVEVVAAKYDEDVLVHNSRLLMAADREATIAKDADAERRLLMVGPNDDRSGLVARMAPGTRVSDADQQALLKAMDEPIPIEFVVDDLLSGGENLARHNDSAPWQGGGATNIGGVHGCSTGFAVTGSTGQGRLLSAAHCYDVGNVAHDGANQVIGSVTNERLTHDAVLIDPAASPATIGKVFTGPWNSDTFRWVSGAGAPSEGDPVCTSGANSGERCGMDILLTNQTLPCADNMGSECTGFIAHGSGHKVANGDSGGPIYIRRTGGKATARGIIARAIGAQATCSATMRQPEPCYSYVFSVGIHKILDSSWNLTIETGP